MIKIAVTGAAGRMGKMLIQAVVETPGVTLGAVLVSPNSNLQDIDAGELAGISKLGVLAKTNILEVADDFDVLIDFTHPELTLANMAHCVALQKAAVVGTTGLTASQLEQLKTYAQSIPLVFAPNMSVGVNLLIDILQHTAQVLGDGYDVEVIETHHRNKVDAPSGTALRLGQAVADGLGRNLDDCAVYAREGITGPRTDTEIGFQTIRAGDVVGEHTVLFATSGERIEITHKASNRMTFAKGAVRASQWLANRPNGLYDMQDVLGLSSKSS